MGGVLTRWISRLLWAWVGLAIGLRAKKEAERKRRT
jgi:hypothetical protein